MKQSAYGRKGINGAYGGMKAKKAGGRRLAKGRKAPKAAKPKSHNPGY